MVNAGTEQLKSPIQLDNDDGTLINPAMEDGNLAIIAGDTTSIDGKITACNTGAVVISSGSVTETNSSAIKTAVELIDNAISGNEMQVDVITIPAITGTVTADAGTNLNTSALALESGGNLASIKTAVELIDNAISGSEMQVDIITSSLPSGASTLVGQQDTLDQYKITDIDADASPNYYGFMDKDGNYYFLKETVSAGADTYRYWKGIGDYVNDWTARASKSYDYFNAIF